MTDEERRALPRPVFAPPSIPDAWIQVRYFDVPGEKVGSTRMSMSDLIKWLENNPGTLICGLEEV
jgi:hypothetical protein